MCTFTDENILVVWSFEKEVIPLHHKMKGSEIYETMHTKQNSNFFQNYLVMSEFFCIFALETGNPNLKNRGIAVVNGALNGLKCRVRN